MHRVNPEPNSIVFKIVARCGGTSKGWLSKYVIDNYLNILVEKFNLENNSQKFGALNFDNSACILENKVKRPSIFDSQLLIEKCKKIHQLVRLF